MNASPSLRLKPLAVCLAAALAIVPTAALLSDRAHAAMRSTADVALGRTGIAPAVAMAVDHRRAPSMSEVVRAAADRARAARPAPNRPAGVTLVTSCDDAGTGTLRDALTNAVSGDTVDMSGLACATISLTTGAITTTADDVMLKGPGASALTIDAGELSGIVNHYGTGTLTIEDLTLTNGHIEGQDFHGGACVLSSANVVVNDSTLSNCYAYMGHAYGGAICAVGNVTLSHSTLSGNTTKGHYYYYYYPGYPNPYIFNGTSWGGGAYAAGRFTITDSTITHNRAEMNNRGSVGGGIASGVSGHLISGSTFDNNAAWLGGGIDILGDFGGEPYGLTIVNSTISGNESFASGAGVGTFYLAYVTLHNSTVTGNSAGYYCGGVYVYYGNADIQSSIIGGNSSVYDHNQFGYYTAADLDVFSGSATISGGHNAIMTSNAPTPPDTLTDDPLLLPLADNGGPTMTHAFDLTSVVLDAGSNPDALAFDQRGAGYPRETGEGVDIGAFEAPGSIPDPIFANGFD
jgi:hypothetical protein